MTSTVYTEQNNNLIRLRSFKKNPIHCKSVDQKFVKKKIKISWKIQGNE